LGSNEAGLDVVWKRPEVNNLKSVLRQVFIASFSKELAAKPKFIVDGITRFDVNQGRLGDCWFLAAIADLTQRPEYISQVIPDGQSFRKESYCGVFHFM
jgi:Calpain family cysteine protease